MTDNAPSHRRAVRRHRQPRALTLARQTWATLDARAAASGDSVSREVDRAVAESAGDHVRLRLAVSNALGPILSDVLAAREQLATIRAKTVQPGAVAAAVEAKRRLVAVEGAVAARAVLVKPAARNEQSLP